MGNSYFRFKQFTVHQAQAAMKVTTDACLFGAWVAAQMKPGVGRVLDIGAGTGLLSLMLAQQARGIIDAIEIQEADYHQALVNISNSEWSDRIQLIHADVLQFDPDDHYDLIISNPPFYEADLKGSRQNKNIAHHDEGLLLTYFIATIKRLLKEEGIFFILYPAKREAALIAAIDDAGLFVEEICWVQQTEKHEPFRIMLKGSTKAKNIKKTFITIKEGDDYSADFIRYLSPYYLYL